jgi:hypothetical protein
VERNIFPWKVAQGTLLKRLVEEGSYGTVGDVIAYIGDPEDLTALETESTPNKPAADDLDVITPTGPTTLATPVSEPDCNRLEDHPTLVNLMWEKQNRPDYFAQIDKALTIDGYIRLKLTGKATANFSSGAFFGIAYDLRQNKFDEELLGKISLDPRIMRTSFPVKRSLGLSPKRPPKNFASNISGKWAANPGRQECLAG